MSTPTWFTDAIAQPYDALELDVEGARITYRAWGKPGHPSVVLVHGGAANAAWWDHVAPFLAAQQLADLGYLPADAVDGVAGEQTRFAVVAFQKWEGLGRDGVVGPVTRAALAEVEAPTRPPLRKSTPALPDWDLTPMPAASMPLRIARIRGSRLVVSKT